MVRAFLIEKECVRKFKSEVDNRIPNLSLLNYFLKKKLGLFCLW